MTYLPLRVRAKFLIKSIFPEKLFLMVLAIWRRTGAKLIKYPEILGMYQKQFIDTYGLNVVGGPFKGMKYVDQSVGSSYLLKLVGSYEEVLHPAIRVMQKRDYSSIIDIGCAEGYYLVGLGLSHPKAKLVGYDLEESALRLTRELYDKNNLPNELVLEKDCTHEKLSQQIVKNTLIICDAEGFEKIILDPEKCPSLKDVQTLLIESHDFIYPDMKNILIRRFSHSHDITTVAFKHANEKNYPFLHQMKNKLDRYNILYERVAQDQEWLILEKK